jgi:chlorobactene glucosyltransferase
VGVLAALPWLLGPLVLALVVRLPRPLPGAPPARDSDGAGPDPIPAPSSAPAPASADVLVSIVVPARNEARNIETVLGSLAATRGVAFEVIVVDDRSEDGTADLARAVPPGRARRVVVLEGDPLADGWLGKPWACHQGAREADGQVLLFTDADTVHGPDLLARALAALDEDDADAVTLVGRQLLGSFWERLVQPQVFLSMLLRYPRHTHPLPPERWRDALANGQYILARRGAYEAIGGHASVRGEVVEDLRLAQTLVRAGRRLSMRRAEDALATRMYRSLPELIEGWTKNLLLGGRATMPPGVLRQVMPPLVILWGFAAWLLPPLALMARAGGLVGPEVGQWALLASGASVGFWAVVNARFGVSLVHGLLYPLGASVLLWIMVRAWVRGPRVRWKGREYRVG